MWQFDIKKIESAREEAGMTQAVAAAHIGATKQQWSAWVAGHNLPSIKTLSKICALFGKAPDYFFTRGVIQNG